MIIMYVNFLFLFAVLEAFSLADFAENENVHLADVGEAVLCSSVESCQLTPRKGYIGFGKPNNLYKPHKNFKVT